MDYAPVLLCFLAPLFSLRSLAECLWTRIIKHSSELLQRLSRHFDHTHTLTHSHCELVKTKSSKLCRADHISVITSSVFGVGGKFLFLMTLDLQTLSICRMKSTGKFVRWKGKKPKYFCSLLSSQPRQLVQASSSQNSWGSYLLRIDFQEGSTDPAVSAAGNKPVRMPAAWLCVCRKASPFQTQCLASVVQQCHCSDTTELVPPMQSWVDAWAGRCCRLATAPPLSCHLQEVTWDHLGSVKTRMDSLPDCGCLIATCVGLSQNVHCSEVVHVKDVPCFAATFHSHSTCCSPWVTECSG